MAIETQIAYQNPAWWHQRCSGSRLGWSGSWVTLSLMQNPEEDVLAAAAQLVAHSARKESGTAGQQVRQAEQDLHGCC